MHLRWRLGECNQRCADYVRKPIPRTHLRLGARELCNRGRSLAADRFVGGYLTLRTLMAGARRGRRPWPFGVWFDQGLVLALLLMGFLVGCGSAEPTGHAIPKSTAGTAAAPHPLSAHHVRTPDGGAHAPTRPATRTPAGVSAAAVKGHIASTRQEKTCGTSSRPRRNAAVSEPGGHGHCASPRRLRASSSPQDLGRPGSPGSPPSNGGTKETSRLPSRSQLGSPGYGPSQRAPQRISPSPFLGQPGGG